MIQIALCLFVAVLAVVKADEKLISKGSWRFIAIDECEDSEKYKMNFNVTKHKISRLEDAFDAGCSLPNGLDKTYSLHADIEKYTDGGWKNYQVIKDNCFLCFCEKYAQENFYVLKEAMGLDRNQDSIPKGDYAVSRYKFNYCELPPDGIPGTFRVQALVLDAFTLPKGCVVLTLEFKDEEDDCGE